MKTKHTLFRRNGIYYSQGSTTGKQKSLGTRDEAAARKLVEATNEAHRSPILNLQLARAYLSASDPASLLRTWQTVMDQMQTRGALRQGVSGRYGQDRLGAGCPNPGTAGLVFAYRKAVKRATQKRNRFLSYLSDQGMRLARGTPLAKGTEALTQLHKLKDWSSGKWWPLPWAHSSAISTALPNPSNWSNTLASIRALMTAAKANDPAASPATGAKTCVVC